MKEAFSNMKNLPNLTTS